eukprot:gene12076-13321_t
MVWFADQYSQSMARSFTIHNLVLFWLVILISTATASDVSISGNFNLGLFAKPTTTTPATPAVDTCKAIPGRYESCACVMQKSGGIINLNGIISNCSYSSKGCVTPRFTVQGLDTWTYSYHPCEDFSLFQNLTRKFPGYRPCKNVASARYTSLSVHECDGLGQQSRASFRVRESLKNNSFITSNLTLEFQNKTTQNSAVISLVCNSSVPANESIMTFLGIKNVPYNTYFMSLESECCCPNGCYLADLPSDERQFKPSKDFWYIVAIACGIVLFLMIGAAVVAYRRKRRPGNSLKRPLLDPLT